MSFAEQITAWSDKTKARLRLTTTELYLSLGISLIDKSPVGDPTLWENKAPKGYIPGTFKANWNGGFGAIDDTTTDETDPTGELSLVRISSAIPEDNPYGIFYITNSLPYARPLEDGHSKQAPFGMVGLTVLEFDQIFAASLAKGRAI
jgi:hypothetical protein